jgi:hypothetical protein
LVSIKTGLLKKFEDILKIQGYFKTFQSPALHFKTKAYMNNTTSGQHLIQQMFPINKGTVVLTLEILLIPLLGNINLMTLSLFLILA